MTLFRSIRTWLGRATGIGYRSLRPLSQEPERRKQRRAAKKITKNALSIIKELDRLERMLNKEQPESGH
jgi:hypothetical protein